jgi:hypothetical protein
MNEFKPTAPARLPSVTIVGSRCWWTPSATSPAVVTGSAQIHDRDAGDALDVAVTVVLATEDGTLPDPGVKVPASLTMIVEHDEDVIVAASAVGFISGERRDSPDDLATHMFTGRYRLTGSERRHLRRPAGSVEICLALGGIAAVFALDI